MKARLLQCKEEEDFSQQPVRNERGFVDNPIPIVVVLLLLPCRRVCHPVPRALLRGFAIQSRVGKIKTATDSPLGLSHSSKQLPTQLLTVITCACLLDMKLQPPKHENVVTRISALSETQEKSIIGPNIFPLPLHCRICVYIKQPSSDDESPTSS